MVSASKMCATCRWGPVTPPRQMTEAETAWVAGIIEGEGSFIAAQSLVIAVRMTDYDIIERLLSVTDVGTIYSLGKQKDHHRPCRRWTVKRQVHVRYLAEAVMPWLGQRRTIAAQILLDRLAELPGSLVA